MLILNPTHFKEELNYTVNLQFNSNEKNQLIYNKYDIYYSILIDLLLIIIIL